jgi:lipoic acid synthetase
MMLGCGERPEEVIVAMRDLKANGVDVVTLGQYLRPSLMHLPVDRFAPPEEFAEYKRIGLEMGFSHVESAPMVRSSYHAHAQADRVPTMLPEGVIVAGETATA